jgi:putative molybdenum carrier protein
MLFAVWAGNMDLSRTHEHVEGLKIISGGQTGVDRAALDVAMELGLACGGWCPKGRRAEDGPIPAGYPLQESASAEYPPRTAMNVRAADGTLVLMRGAPDRGTALTIHIALAGKKPLLTVDLTAGPAPVTICDWLEANEIRTLNVAGPRESSCPGIHAQARELLRAVLQRRAQGRDTTGQKINRSP